MRFTIALLASALVAMTSALPSSSSPLEDRQGGFYVAVGNKYASGGCASTPVGDPIFGSGNVCQAINRNADSPAVVSYKTLSTYGGPRCNVTLYTDANCQSPGFAAPVGGCVQASSPFVSVFVNCNPPI